MGVVAYRTLADGLLSGAVTEEPTAGPALHLTPPRLKGDNLRHNLQAVERLKAMAADKGCSPAQLAVAWLLAQGEDVVPLIGMRRRSRLQENLAVLDLPLGREELAALDEAFGPGAIFGERYPPFVLKFAAR